MWLRFIWVALKQNKLTHGVLTALINKYQRLGLTFVSGQSVLYHVKKLSKVKEEKEKCVVVAANDGDSVSMLTMSTRTPSSLNANMSLVLFALLASKIEPSKGGRPTKEMVVEGNKKKLIIQEATTLAARLLHCKKANLLLDKGHGLTNGKLKEVVEEAERHFALKEGSVKRFNVDGKNSDKFCQLNNLRIMSSSMPLPLLVLVCY